MGMRYTLRLFKGNTPVEFRDAMQAIAESVNAVLTWNHTDAYDMRLAHSGDVHTLYIPYQDGSDTFFCEALGKRLAIPWMELRIQEGSLWDYSLCDGGIGVDNFSTLPQYWLEDPENPDPEYMNQWKGDALVLARLWNLPVNRIDKYLVNWGYRIDPSDPDIFHCDLTGKAYPTDRAPYGDYEQFFDFLRALGGTEPIERHSLRLPPRSEWKR